MINKKGSITISEATKKIANNKDVTINNIDAEEMSLFKEAALLLKDNVDDYIQKNLNTSEYIIRWNPRKFNLI